MLQQVMTAPKEIRFDTVPIPQHMTYNEGAMIEPLAVTVHAVKRMGDVTGLNVAVLDCGPIGILLIQSLKALGAAKVMATDISDYRLELAHKCGADVVVNTRHNDFGKALVDTFGPDKADIIYDCAGNNITMDQAIQNARKGSTIILVAVFADMARCDLPKLNDSELGLNFIDTEINFLPFWANGVRFFNVLGPNGEKVEFGQIL